MNVGRMEIPNKHFELLRYTGAKKSLCTLCEVVFSIFRFFFLNQITRSRTLNEWVNNKENTWIDKKRNKRRKEKENKRENK